MGYKFPVGNSPYNLKKFILMRSPISRGVRKQDNSCQKSTQKSDKAGIATGSSFGKRNGLFRKPQKERKEMTEGRKRKPQRKGKEEAPFQGDGHRIYLHPGKFHHLEIISEKKRKRNGKRPKQN